MHYTVLIGEENFTPGRPLVLVLPQAEEATTSNQVSYLIQELHTSSRWPVLVFNVNNEMNRNMYTEIHQHYTYIILIAGTCKIWEQNTFDFQKKLIALSEGTLRESWNPNARFVIQFMANCTHSDSKTISHSILSHLWTYQVSNVIVLFRKPNAHGSNDLQPNTSDLAKGTYLEIHKWYPYENSDRCNPADGTVPVNVFTVRNLSDIRRNDLFIRLYDKNFHKCPISVRAYPLPPLVKVSKRVWNNVPGYQFVYEDGWEIDTLKIIGKSLNLTLDIESGDKKKFRTSPPAIYVGGRKAFPSTKFNLTESSRNYLTVHFAWYTPCAAKYQKWSRFFNIFSVDMWICFALSLVLAVITVSCISNYRYKSHLHQSNTYSNISSATTNIIAVVLSVSVNTQPRSAPLRLFFFCWVCYSVAISTVFQAYLTTFLIEPGYVEPIRTVEQMLASDMKFGFYEYYKKFFTDSSDPTDSTILKNAVLCRTRDICFKWANDYQNFSTILSDFEKVFLYAVGIWTYENYRPLTCEIEYGGVETSGVVLLVSRGSPLLEFINDAIDHIVEGGIFLHISNLDLYKMKLNAKFVSPSDDTYYAVSIRQLQTAFYLLMMGHAVAVVCFVVESLWHFYRSKCRGPTGISLRHGQA